MNNGKFFKGELGVI